MTSYMLRRTLRMLDMPPQLVERNSENLNRIRLTIRLLLKQRGSLVGNSRLESSVLAIQFTLLKQTFQIVTQMPGRPRKVPLIDNIRMEYKRMERRREIGRKAQDKENMGLTIDYSVGRITRSQRK
jgi:hypothetical protein